MAKAQKNASQVAKKWASNLGASTTSITEGVNAVQTAPGQTAAARQQLMKAKLNAAIDSGKWASRVSSVPLGDWKQAMLTKGVQRVATGAQAAEGKMTKFMNELLPVAAAISAQVDSMPKNTIEDSVARAGAAIRAMAAFGASRK